MNYKLRLIFAVLILTVILCACAHFDNDYYIFSNISECNNFEINKDEDAKITYYTTPEKDSNLKDLEYDSFFGAKYLSLDIEFEIFAYEFKDSNSAKKYFNNVTGKNSEELDTNFSASMGMTSYRLVIIDFKKAYIVQGPSSNAEAIQDFLKENFTVKIGFEGQ